MRGVHRGYARPENQRFLRPFLFHVAPTWTGSRLRFDHRLQRRSAADGNGIAFRRPERSVLAEGERRGAGHWGVSGCVTDNCQGLRNDVVLGRKRPPLPRRLAQAACRGARAAWSGHVRTPRDPCYSSAFADNGIFHNAKAVGGISAVRHGQTIEVSVRARRTRPVAPSPRPQHPREARHLGWRVGSGTVEATAELPLARRSIKSLDAIESFPTLAGSRRNPKTKLVSIC